MDKSPNRVIICAAGNSIPFDNEKGLNVDLKDILQYEYTIGLNYWYKFACKPTWTTWVDWQWYRDNLEDIRDMTLLIGKHDPMLTHEKILQNNTYLLKANGKYFGHDSWNQGFYSTHLCGLFALTLAINLDFEEIYLLGYDCKAINNKTHFYQEIVDLKERTVHNTIRYRGIGMTRTNHGMVYKTGTYTHKEKINNHWYAPYKDELEKTKIINVSPESAINIFPKITYEEFYEIIKKNPGKIIQSRGREKIKDLLEKKIVK